jgi:hypothetical protein
VERKGGGGNRRIKNLINMRFYWGEKEEGESGGLKT